MSRQFVERLKAEGSAYSNWPINIRAGLKTIGSTYSDCTILLRSGDKIHTHRIVLHINSPILATLLSASARDSVTLATLDLTKDDPHVVRAMLYSFYHDHYNVPGTKGALAFHADVFRMAIRYNATALSDLANRLFEQALSRGAWDANDLMETAIRMEQTVEGTPPIEMMSNSFIKAITKYSKDLYDTPGFKSYIQANPESIIDLLKLNRPDTELSGNGATGSGGEHKGGATSNGGVGGWTSSCWDHPNKRSGGYTKEF